MLAWLLVSALAVLLAAPAALVSLGFLARALWTGVRLPDPPPGVAGGKRLRSALGLFLLEWLSTLRVILTWPAGLVTLPAPSGAPPEGQRPVLLLPGYGQTSASLGPLRRFLRRSGLVSVSALTPPLLAPPRRVASRVLARVRALSEGALGLPVDVVGFGASGVLVGEVLAADPSCPLGRVVALGSPHRGSPAGVLWPGPGAPDLLPDRPALACWSELLSVALAPPLPGGVEGPRWVCIRSADDPWIPPDLGSAPPGSVEVVVVHAGHLRLLHDRAAFEAVSSALRGDADSPEGAPSSGPAGDRP